MVRLYNSTRSLTSVDGKDRYVLLNYSSERIVKKVKMNGLLDPVMCTEEPSHYLTSLYGGLEFGTCLEFDGYGDKVPDWCVKHLPRRCVSKSKKFNGFEE